MVPGERDDCRWSMIYELKSCLLTSTSTSTSIYWHSCCPKAEQLDKTRKCWKTCKQHNKPKWTQHNEPTPKWREGSSSL